VYAALLPYAGVACFLLLVSGARSWRLYDTQVDRWLAVLLVLTTAIIAGSNDLGTDAASYRDNYEKLWGYADQYVWWEPGFEAFATLFAGLGAPYGLFVFVCVALSNSIKLYVFDVVTENRMLAFAALYCLELCDIGFVRQYLAASLILLSFLLTVRHRLVSAILVIFAATLIHKTALIAGLIILVFNLRRSALKAFLLLAVIGGLCAYALPHNFIESMAPRLLTQVAIYTDEGYVQGLESGPIALFRNVVKFLFYLGIASWMVMLPAATWKEQMQKKAGYLVIIVSIISILLIAIVSPVFSRMSVYVFPFLALSLRAERFRLVNTQVFAQSGMVMGFVANLAIFIYPLIEQDAF
jgi:hypothetical protein